jgi:predicted MFS family arabinose efflux permease
VRGNLGVGRAISFCSGLYNLGAVLGPVTGGFIADKMGLKTIYICAGIAFFVSTVIVFFTAKDPGKHHADQTSLQPTGLLKNYRFLAVVIITGITLFAIYLPQPLTSNFLQNQQHLSRTTIGFIGAAGSLGNAVATLALGNLNAFLGFITSQVWVFIFALIYLKSGSAAWLGIGYFFFGGYRLCRSMVLAIARPLVHPNQTGLAFGMMETANAAAVITAPVLAGFLYRNDPYSIYRVSAWLIAGVILLNLIIFWVNRKRQKINHELAN